jgi:Tfp pilus assembly protein PilF
MSFMSIQNTSFHDRERLLAVHSHPDVATTCENIGLVLIQQGKVEKAKDKFQEAADIRRAKLGAHHALTKKSERCKRFAANCL